MWAVNNAPLAPVIPTVSFAFCRELCVLVTITGLIIARFGAPTHTIGGFKHVFTNEHV